MSAKVILFAGHRPSVMIPLDRKNPTNFSHSQISSAPSVRYGPQSKTSPLDKINDLEAHYLAVEPLVLNPRTKPIDRALEPSHLCAPDG